MYHLFFYIVAESSILNYV